MAATTTDIRKWLIEGQRQKATHMIVACDTYDWCDYPIFVSSEQDVKQEVKKYYRKDMQKVMEVYSLALNIDMQLAESTAWHLE